MYPRQSPRQVAVPHARLTGRTATRDCAVLLVRGALAHSGTVLHTDTVTTPHSRVGLLRGALSESGNKEKYALVNITGRTEEASRPTPHKKMNGFRYFFSLSAGGRDAYFCVSTARRMSHPHIIHFFCRRQILSVTPYGSMGWCAPTGHGRPVYALPSPTSQRWTCHPLGCRCPVCPDARQC